MFWTRFLQNEKNNHWQHFIREHYFLSIKAFFQATKSQLHRCSNDKVEPSLPSHIQQRQMFSTRFLWNEKNDNRLHFIREHYFLSLKAFLFELDDNRCKKMEASAEMQQNFLTCSFFYQIHLDITINFLEMNNSSSLDNYLCVRQRFFKSQPRLLRCQEWVPNCQGWTQGPYSEIQSPSRVPT